MRKTGKYYWLTVGCYSTFTVGIIPILLFTGWISHSLWGTVGGLIICGFSNGIGGTSSLIALSKEHIPPIFSVMALQSPLMHLRGSCQCECRRSSGRDWLFSPLPVPRLRHWDFHLGRRDPADAARSITRDVAESCQHRLYPPCAGEFGIN